MADKKKTDASWSAGTMITHAKSLQRVVEKLGRNRPESPASDPLLFTGTILAGPILLSLAIEIALKAWQCRERGQAPDRTHDLLKLLNGLESGTRELLEARVPGIPEVPWIPPYKYGSLPELLSTHRNAHTHWRYIHETHTGGFRAAELDRALTAIVDTYEDRWADVS